MIFLGNMLSNISPLAYVVAGLLATTGVQTWRLDAAQEELGEKSVLLEAADTRYNRDVKLLSTSVKSQNEALRELAENYSTIDVAALNALPELAKAQAKEMAVAQVSMLKAINKLKVGDTCESLTDNYKSLIVELPRD